MIAAAHGRRGPSALGLLGVVLATLLLVASLERGGGWRWVAYALVAASLHSPIRSLLPFSLRTGRHCIARRDRATCGRGSRSPRRDDPRRVLLAWMAADRFDIPDGTVALDLLSVGRGAARAIGWNPVLAAAAIAGIVVLFRTRDAVAGAWRGVLVAA